MLTCNNIAFIIAVIAAINDLAYYRIPNSLTYPALIAGLIWHSMGSGLSGLAYSSIGVAISFACLFPVFLARGFGAGDVKLLMALGAWLGPRSIVNLLLISLTINGLVSGIILVFRHSESSVIKVLGYLFKRAFEAIGFELDRNVDRTFSTSPDARSDAVEKVPLAVIVLIGMIVMLHFGLVIL